jgi:O-antigen ligase/polysaccharide polymerase Wzy-like membrane protein
VLSRGSALSAGLIALAVALLVAAAVHVLGTVGLLVPLALLAAVLLVKRPLLSATLVVGLTIFCEGPYFGLFNFTSHLYDQLYRDISLLDALVGLVVVAGLADVLRTRRALRLPRALGLPLALLALAMLAGVITGHAAGVSLRYSIFSEHVLAYLLALPIVIANLDIDDRRITQLLGGAMGLAIVKAILGLIEIHEHLGTQIEGSTTLTYYEATANYVMMIALLTLLVAALIRAKPPLWTLLGSPLVLASLLLSYRRSFWIASALGLLLVIVLATSPAARRMLIPAALAVAAAIWLLGSIHFQSNLPLVKRVTSLSASNLEANREDRYRLDERANVLGEISAHPITGLGMGVPWQATVTPLSVEHEGGREYVHFAALWYWLKLGILGLLAYLGVLAGSVLVAWRGWRCNREPLLRAFALASACGIVGLATIETTGSFTGVEARFTAVLATQLGLLALIARRRGTGVDADPRRG